MKEVRITAVRRTEYPDLMALYENPMEHACDVAIGQVFISRNGERPDGLCPEAWESMRHFVEELAAGRTNLVVCYRDSHIVTIPINEALEMKKSLDPYMYKVAYDISI